MGGQRDGWFYYKLKHNTNKSLTGFVYNLSLLKILISSFHPFHFAQSLTWGSLYLVLLGTAMVMVMMTTIHYLSVLVVLGVGGSRGRGVGRGGVALRWGVVQVLWGQTCKYTDQIQSKNTIEKYSSEIRPPHETLT